MTYETQRAGFSAASTATTLRALPRPEALRWFAGVYFLILGTSLLILPQGALGPWLGAMWLRSAATFASGLLLLWLVVLEPSSGRSYLLHALAALPHLIMGVEYALLGVYTPAATLLLLGFGVLVAPLLPTGAAAHGGRRPDALGLVLGGAMAVQGAELLLRPAAGQLVPTALGITPGLVGAVFLVGGLGVVLTQLSTALPRPILWAAHLFAGGALLGLWVAQSWLEAPVYWALGAAALVRGLALAALPWSGQALAALDVRALRVRLALALLTAVLVPLAIVLPIVLGDVQRRRVELSLARQQQAAVISTAFIAELAGDQRALLRQLAVDARLTALSPAEQQRLLSAARATDDRLAGLGLYDASGALLAVAGEAARTAPAPELLPAPGEPLASSVAGVASRAGATIAQAEPLRDANGRLGGVLVALAAPEAIAFALSAADEAGSVTALVDAQGRPVVLSAPAQERPLPDLPALLEQGAALTADGAASGIVVSVDGGPRLLGAAPVPDLPWRVVTVIPQTVMLADLTPLRQLAFALMLLAAGIGGATGWWLAGRLVRPIRDLMQSIGRIAEGDRQVHFSPDGPSELANLSSAVGSMAAALDARFAEREGLVAQLQTQNQELRDLEEAREEWIRALSHDLRNPLTAIFGNAQRLIRLLSATGFDKERRIAQTIVAGGQRMNSMIQDLADALRVDAGEVPLRRQPVDLPAMIAELGTQLGTPEDAARIRLLAAEIPPVEADPGLLDRVLTNLLSNALKYSPPEAPVLVSLQASERQVTVAISDRGIGMTPEEQQQLFRRYYRAEGAQTMAGGLGLGLYVTRALVEAHGGQIWVESTPGEGSTFRFTLPSR